MRIVAGGKFNLLSWVLDTTAKTLVISNAVGFDIEAASIQSIWSTTASVAQPVGKNVVSNVLTYVAGLPVWTLTFTTMGAGIANGDTLIILLDVPDNEALYSILAYQASTL